MKTMVKKSLDQKVRARNYEGRNERNVAGTQGSQSAVKESREIDLCGGQSAICFFLWLAANVPRLRRTGAAIIEAFSRLFTQRTRAFTRHQ